VWQPGREHRDAEDHPERDPERVSIPDLSDRILKIEELRDQYIDRDQQQDDRDARLDQALRIREEARLSLRDHLAVRFLMFLSAPWALLPHPRDLRKGRYSAAMRSSRCNAPLTARAAGPAYRSPRRIAITSAAPASRSTT
jgi:hypothetical protein